MVDDRERVRQFEEARKPKRILNEQVYRSEWPFQAGEAILVEGVAGYRRADYKFTKIDTLPDSGLKDAIQRRLESPLLPRGYALGIYSHCISVIVSAAPDFRPDLPEVKELLDSLYYWFDPTMIFGHHIDELVQWRGFARCGSDAGLNITYFQSWTDPVLFLTTGRYSKAVP